jgi:hypothetical protein
MPLKLLVKKWRGEGSPEVRNLIDAEIARRRKSRQWMIGTTIALLTLFVGAAALFRSQ